MHGGSKRLQNHGNGSLWILQPQSEGGAFKRLQPHRKRSQIDGILLGGDKAYSPRLQLTLDKPINVGLSVPMMVRKRHSIDKALTDVPQALEKLFWTGDSTKGHYILGRA